MLIPLITTLFIPRKGLLVAGLVGVVFICSGHIGSPSIILTGKAGEYDLIANITPPDVVPGLAEISVQVKQKGIKGVAIQGIYYRNGSEGAPDPEKLKAVPGTENLFTGQIWLMEGGSASVKIIVNGLQGKGSTVVPIPALRISEPEMDQSLGIVLIILGTILFVGLVTLISSSVGQATLAAGATMTRSQKQKAMLTALITGIGLVGVLWMGHKWWMLEENYYRKTVFRNTPMTTNIVSAPPYHKLTIELEEPNYYDRVSGDLVPDHGKLMHIFVIDTSTQNHFAHLHPIRIDSFNYEVVLPNQLPSDTYHLFVDIVHSSGLSETLYDTISIPSGSSTPEPIPVSEPYIDPDDSWYQHLASQGANVSVDEGIHIMWKKPEQLPIYANQLQSLTFSASNEQGIPMPLAPYLTMLGHAAILKSDAAVFIHLHPVGTISMAAQEVMANRINDDLVTICQPLDSTIAVRSVQISDPRAVTNLQDEILEQMEAQGLTHEVSFPYAFPEPGTYRIWVQMRVAGKIHTAAFDIQVVPPLDS